MNLKKEKHQLKKYQNLFDLKEKIKKLSSERKITYKESEIFFKSLSELTNAGIPLIKIFEMDTMTLKDKKIIQSIKANLEKGNSLSSSLQDTKVFNYIAISIIKTGEETGDLSLAFEKLSNYYQKLDESKKMVQSSMFYPSILIISIIFLLMFINYHFIPTVMDMYEYNIEKLNKFTQIMLKISIFSNTYKIESLMLILSIIGIIYIILIEIYSKRQDNNMLMNIPVISKIIINHTMSNILWGYSIMLSSGIDMIKSSIIIQDQIKNKFAKEKLQIFKESISSGNSLQKSIEKLNLNDENLSYFISIGEKSGNIDKNIKILSDIYTSKFDKDIKRLSQIIQPALIIIITFIVGLLMIGLIIPILSYEYIM